MEKLHEVDLDAIYRAHFANSSRMSGFLRLYVVHAFSSIVSVHLCVSIVVILLETTEKILPSMI